MSSWHHHAHPRDDLSLKEAGGLVVRTVRLQLAEGLGGQATRNWWGSIRKKHGEHQRYHLFYGGPPLPQSPKEQFEYAVWAASGYVPENALDVKGRHAKEVKMAPDQIKRLQNGEIRVGSKQLLSDFLKDYIFDQDFSHIEDTIIDEFVSRETDWERKKYLGYWLLSQASEVATESIDLPYREARKLGLVSLQMSSRISDVVQAEIRNPKRKQQSIIQQLEHRFAT